MALVKCPECGKDVSDKAVSCPHCGFPMEKMENNIDGWQETGYEKENWNFEEYTAFNQTTTEKKIPMPIPMVVAACMSFVLSALLMNQSITMFRLFSIAGRKDIGGLIGILMALLWILSGMLAICFRNMASEMGALICFAICLLTGFVGILFETDYRDLMMWTVFVFIYSFIYFVIAACIKVKSNNKR